MEIAKLSNVYKSYNGKTILSDVTMTLNEGEIIGLIGPSGVGKTTIIKLLTAQTKVDQGSVHVFGCDINKWDNKNNSRIGIMMDNIGCYDRMTCYENLELYCKIYGISTTVINDVLEKVDLRQEENKMVSALSKGMRQRILFARALLNAPKFLILDEPTSDLDPKTVLRLHNVIKDLKKEGTTILITTHDMQEATEVCDDIELIYQGKVIEHGTPEDICDKYNLQSQICIVDQDKKEVCLPNNKESAKTVFDYLAQENVLDIYLKKPDLKNIFLKLTGCEIDDFK